MHEEFLLDNSRRVPPVGSFSQPMNGKNLTPAAFFIMASSADEAANEWLGFPPEQQCFLLDCILKLITGCFQMGGT